MIEEGIVTEVGQTAKGTPKAKVGGEWYFGGRGVNFYGTVGKKILVEWQPFGDKGMRGAKNWSLAPFQPSASEVASAQAPKANAPLEPSNAITEGERAFCSNVIAHAIDAKLITSQTDLSTWVQACVGALRKWDESIPY